MRDWASLADRNRQNGHYKRQVDLKLTSNSILLLLSVSLAFNKTQVHLLNSYECVNEFTFVFVMKPSETPMSPSASNERQRLILYDKFGAVAGRDCGVKLNFQLTTSTAADVCCCVCVKEQNVYEN